MEMYVCVNKFLYQEITKLQQGSWKYFLKKD